MIQVSQRTREVNVIRVSLEHTSSEYFLEQQMLNQVLFGAQCQGHGMNPSLHHRDQSEHLQIDLYAD